MKTKKLKIEGAVYVAEQFEIGKEKLEELAKVKAMQCSGSVSFQFNDPDRTVERTLAE